MLNQTVGYAIEALGHIAAANGRSVLVRDVALAEGIPYGYLAKIINSLARKGFLDTQRGIGGGVRLARSPSKISLYEIAAALDDPVTQERCMLGTDQCSDARACPCHEFWKAKRRDTTQFLKSTTLRTIADFELAKPRKKRKPIGEVSKRNNDEF